MIDNKKIGSRLETLRKEKKETQTDVAKLLGVQRQVISYYETGARLPNIEDLSILADHYNTTVDYLIGRTETKTVEEDIQMICNYTGLSEAAIKELNECFVSQVGYNLSIEEQTDCKNRCKNAADILSYLIVGIPDSSLIASAFLLAFYKERSDKIFCDFKQKNESDATTEEDVLVFLKEASSKRDSQDLDYYRAIDSFKYAADAYIENHCSDRAISKMREALIKKFDCVKGVIKWQV